MFSRYFLGELRREWIGKSFFREKRKEKEGSTVELPWKMSILKRIYADKETEGRYRW